jgi:hypothetical protein
MPLCCSKTGSTALREAEVQQPITEATLSLTRSLRAFSAKVGQSEAPSSWMISILPAEHAALLVDLLDGEFLGLHRAGSEIAIVPVIECRMPTVTGHR